MPIYGISLDKTNPKFQLKDFLIWMPQFRKILAEDDGLYLFEKIHDIANNKIFYSIFGTDWELAMSYCIAHYLTLISEQYKVPVASSLEELQGGQNFKGVLSSATVGGFSKSLDFQYTLDNDANSSFWNQTAYGASLMSIYKTKAVPSIFVVTEGVR